ncbi:hypothetical protein EIL26_00610 [Salmonella enterica subsp. enterica serovar Newport]|uniref:DinI family protein n=1 Tax=Salmonella enterica subsp. enterica serovar Panama TaxID=29472 RepID=A0A5U8J714_SALET|nr:hypothetical protein [Salmonella enterica]EBR7995503.1 hypothetical protein [Salmonella enterica subsp. enterica serovar Panama]ECA0400406.1 hypothetical protein [Salmonella enterica subsp. enterica serovar Newport]EEN2096136.1 hypothetical protein [Salmonella enterica subsp. enterica serovar Florida]EIE2746998.1 hypothetical protein [Salmonella enterica subsp. diarizonae serovar 48:i:z]ASD85735.1 hypothetical protein LFZ16_05445 [Salmonella enterica subsp. enterica serovar India str. SA200
MTTIQVDVAFSDMGETSESSAKVYISELLQRIESEYPDALVTVSLDMRGFGGETIVADSLDDEDAIKERLDFISADVWNNGTWHNVD